MFCSKCGKEVPDGVENCPVCGNAVQNWEEAPNVQQVPRKRVLPTVLIVILVAIALVVVIGLLRAMKTAQERASAISCTSNIKQIGLALAQYAIDYENFLPPWDNARGLEILRSTGVLTDYAVYVCPSSGTKPGSGDEPLNDSNCDYLYLGGLAIELNGAEDCPVAFEKRVHIGNRVNVLYLDGHVSSIQLPDTVQTIADLLKYLADQATNPNVKTFLLLKSGR